MIFVLFLGVHIFILYFGKKESDFLPRNHKVGKAPSLTVADSQIPLGLPWLALDGLGWPCWLALACPGSWLALACLACGLGPGLGNDGGQARAHDDVD